MSLSLVVLTRGGERLERLMRWALGKPYLAALHVFVDDSTAEDVESCSWASSAVLERVPVPNIDQALAYCHSPERIKTDWALHLGDDELMGRWFDEDIERLMRAPYDVYSFPRYNLTLQHSEFSDAQDTGLLYICSKPWYPDWCQRLFRPGYLVHNGEVHEGAQPMGRLAMARPHVFHFDFIEETRKEREAKWKRYLKQGIVAASRRRGLADDYYRRWAVPEDYEHQIAVCGEQL